MKKVYDGLEVYVIELTGANVLTQSLDNDGFDEENWDLSDDL